MPKPIVSHETSQYDLKHAYNQNCVCEACTATFLNRLHRVHEYGYEDPLAPARGILTALALSLAGILIVVVLAWLVVPSTAWPRANQVQPVAAPAALVKARAACPVGKPLKCRAALRKAYAAVEWQQKANLDLAREMLGKLTDWVCIHGGEGAWTSNTGNGYFGGLQMDATFERTYGRDMLQRYHGHADQWPARKQIIVAQRAFSQNRGYAPWPQTSRKCGLR